MAAKMLTQPFGLHPRGCLRSIELMQASLYARLTAALQPK